MLNLQNSILKTKVGKDYNIEITNHPLPYSLETRIFLINTGASVGLQLATNLGLAMAFVSSFFIIYHIKERVTGSKHLQYVSGAKVATLWIVSYFWDFLIFCVVSLAVIITFACYQENGFKSFEDLGMQIFVVF